MGGKKTKGRRRFGDRPKFCLIGAQLGNSTTERSESTASETTPEVEVGMNQPPLVLTAESARAHVQDFYDDMDANVNCKKREVWEALYEKYHCPSFTLIRPSGNPLTYQGCVDILTSDDMTFHSCSLVSVDTVEILAGGLAAVATITADERFTFKGKVNEDRSVKTMVLEVRDGEIKTVFEHRGTGQPVPRQTRWM